jgi:cyclophilin family peptidyl-prolyl cis-trans isomerase
MVKATIETERGTIELEIDPQGAPRAAGNFLDLARKGFYDGVIFHRVVPGFVIQGGDPTGTGRGGPGYTFPDEPFAGDYERGTVAMANAGPDTNGSQFFICLTDLSGRLPRKYTIFGRVTAGMEVVDAIAAEPTGPGDRPLRPVAMRRVVVEETPAG